MSENINQQKPQFSDTSSATRSVKAERVLVSLADAKDYRYYFDDGFPRQEIRQDAAAVLAVMREMAAALARYAATDRDALQMALRIKAEEHQCCSEDLILLLRELQNIANADTSTWDDPNDFKAWAQNRSRAAIAKQGGAA